MYDVNTIKTTYQKWMTLTPKGAIIRTGCGIIVAVEDIPDGRKGYYEGASDGKLYTILTDFGNTFVATLGELESSYEVRWVERDPAARIARQQELITQAEELYFKGL